jgi:ubiquitin fusion degradation protein 1
LQFGGFDDEGFGPPGFMGGFGGMPGIADRVNRRFNEDFRCYSMAMFPGAQRENVDYGGKGICPPPQFLYNWRKLLTIVILPPTALDKLSICFVCKWLMIARLNISYPMLFEARNKSAGTVTHCGVIEFVAEEGRCYLPHWVPQSLNPLSNPNSP